MAITTVDGWVAAAKQFVSFFKTGTATIGAGYNIAVFDLAGSPGAGTPAIGNTANGVVPTDATAGYPTIDAFGGGATGYLGISHFGNSVAGRIYLFDRVFAAGAYNHDDNIALAAQPSFLGRIPGGTAADCAGCTEIWAEGVVTSTGSQSIEVQYTNSAGVAGRTTGAVSSGAFPLYARACFPLPLQAGDSGVSQIDNVQGTVATNGTFNVMVLRRLATARVSVAYDLDRQDLLMTGMPVMFEDSALYVMVQPDAGTTGLVNIHLVIANA